jgi:hypothetical protein
MQRMLTEAFMAGTDVLLSLLLLLFRSPSPALEEEKGRVEFVDFDEIKCFTERGEIS